MSYDHHITTTMPATMPATSLVHPSIAATPMKSGVRSSIRVAVVSPLFNNNPPSGSPSFRGRITYPIKGTSTPFKPNERDNSLLESTFSSERSSKGNYSPYKLDKTQFSQSNSSLSSNGMQNESFGDGRYDLVGYNSSPSTTPVGRDTKPGWYEMHEKHVELASIINPKILLCGDSIVAGLQRYPYIWNKYFKPRGALNCGIGGDQTQHVLWRMENITLPATVRYAVIHCGTNNIDRDSPRNIANGVISSGLVLQEHNWKLQVIVTGLIPRDYEESYRRHKIKETNKHLRHYCKQFNNFTYMKQDSDWVLNDGTLNVKFYYTDHLHLIETGNEKLAASITRTIDKLENNEDVTYSSDEEDNAHKFERKYGERRKETPKRDDGFVIENPFKLSRQSNDNPRKRSLSPSSNDLQRSSSTNQKRMRTDNSQMDNRGYDDRYTARKRLTQSSEEPPASTSNDDIKDNSISFHSQMDTRGYDDRYTARKRLTQSSEAPPASTSTDDIKDNSISFSARINKLDTNTVNEVAVPEYHGAFPITKELKHDKLKGTVKSIDITLTDADRLAARRAKFGRKPVGAGSSLKTLSDSAKAEVRGKAANAMVLVNVKDVIESLGE